jgi:hypothetical protein
MSSDIWAKAWRGKIDDLAHVGHRALQRHGLLGRHHQRRGGGRAGGDGREAHAGGLRTDLAHLLRRAAGGVDLVELGGLLAQGGVCLLRLGGEAFLVPGKVEHVDPGGAEPGGQLLQRGPALLQPLRGLAGLALDFLELGPQLLRRGFGRVQLLAQGGQPCLQGLVLARVVRIAGLGGLVAAHLLLLHRAP